MTVRLSEAAREAAVAQLADTVAHWAARVDEADAGRGRVAWARGRVEEAAAAGGLGLSTGWVWTRQPCEAWWASPVGLLVAATGRLGEADRWVRIPDATAMSGLSRAAMYRRMDRDRLPWRPTPVGREVARDVLARERLAQFTQPR